jgi:hypothetical protein
LRVLHLSCNRELNSLNGLPTHSLETLGINSCKLSGDLVELTGASKLKDLNVGWNLGVTSLKGVPLQVIEELRAIGCRLNGDHTFLSEAPRLRELILTNNPELILDKTKFKPVLKLEV